MKRAQPQPVSQRRLSQILNEAGGKYAVADRVEWISRYFLGRPYRSNPLIGSSERPEVLVASVDSFDCVTYMEAVLALALARNAAGFRRYLKQLRYDAGQIVWPSRNHYMTNWIRNNIREGLVRKVSLTPCIVKERLLDAVPGLPSQRRRFTCLPKKFVPRAGDRIQSGDLIFFASTRRSLDVFHCGIVVKKGNGMQLRHASRSQGRVVEQQLPDFLRQNRMAGVVIVRPVQQD